jgi:hypothetical protein
MRKTIRRSGWILGIIIGLAAAAPQAHALGLSVFGGGSYGISGITESAGYGIMTPRFGGDFTIGLVGPLDAGAYYEANWLSSAAGNGPLHFFGGMLRIRIPLGGLFIDGKFGAASLGNIANSGWNFGFAAGVGYKLFSAGPFGLAPRISYRYVAGSPIQTVDFDAMLMFNF